MKRLLVTGGAGFIGSNFVKYMLSNDSNIQIVILDCLTYAGNLHNISEHLTENNILFPNMHQRLELLQFNPKGISSNYVTFDKTMERYEFKLAGFNQKRCNLDELSNQIENALKNTQLVFVLGSIEDQSIVEALMKSCDAVVNFAAETHVDRSILNPDQFIKTDVYGTFVLLESARKNSTLKKFIHISTDEVYGEAIKHSFSENDPIMPRNPYSASKASADRLVYAYSQTYQLPINIIRPSNNFGPFQYPEKLIPVMIIKALNEEKLPIYGNGKQVRDWLFVNDTARAIELVMKSAPAGEIYNVAGGNERANIFIVKAILQKLEKDEKLINFVKDRPGHDVRYSLDDSKIRKELGYMPQNELAINLNSTIEWYLENQNWWKYILNYDQEYKEFMKNWYKER